MRNAFKIGDIISWSLGLLYATFPKLFTGEMSFDFGNSLSKSVDNYLFPLVMALILFLVGTIYGFLKEMIVNQYSHVVGVFTMLVLFLLAFVLSLKDGDPDISRICLVPKAQFIEECEEKQDKERQNKVSRYILSETYDEDLGTYHYSLHPVSSLYGIVKYVI